MFVVLTLSHPARTLWPMNDLGQTLETMDSTRLLLALVFVAGYAAAIGRLATERGRRWSTGLATLAGLAFVGLTNPWVHGALLVVFAVVGVGAFIALAWALSAWAVHVQTTAAAPVPVALATQVIEPDRTPQSVRIVRHVRRVRRRFSMLARF
jgi:hypothetical protein